MSHEATGKSHDWYTPKYIFDALGVRFDLDVAAPEAGPLHVPAGEWFFHDGLNEPWFGFIWMNPPFGNGDKAKLLWMDRFFDHGNGIALTPDRTSAPWFQKCWRRADAILFVSPKVKFIRPDGSVGEQPGNGTALWAAGSAAVSALRSAARSGLGAFSAMSDISANGDGQ